MKEQHKQRPKEKLSLAQILEDSELMVRYGKMFLLGIVGVMVVLLLLYRLVATSHVNAERDYLNAEAEYSRLKIASDEVGGVGNLEKLKEVLNRRAELHPKYDGLIVQALLENGEVKKAKDFARLALRRVDKKFKALYGKFSENTLLIYEENFESALKQSMILKKELKKYLDSAKAADKEESAALLYAYNLLRVAMLEQEVGSREGESLAWQELRELAKWDKETPTFPRDEMAYAFQQLLRNFQSNGVTLVDYIEDREQALAK